MNKKKDVIDKTAGRIIFLRGKRIVLCALQKERHLENSTRWVNDPENRRTLFLQQPLAPENNSSWLEHAAQGNTNQTFAIELLDGTHIGSMGLHKINWIDGTTTTGAVIGEKKYRGKG